MPPIWEVLCNVRISCFFFRKVKKNSRVNLHAQTHHCQALTIPSRTWNTGLWKLGSAHVSFWKCHWHFCGNPAVMVCVQKRCSSELDMAVGRESRGCGFSSRFPKAAYQSWVAQELLRLEEFLPTPVIEVEHPINWGCYCVWFSPNYINYHKLESW